VSTAGTIVVAFAAVVVIFVVMVVAAVTWAKHGMLPTKGFAAGPLARIPAVRRRLERGNRQFGWGDVGEDVAEAGRPGPPERSIADKGS
jgi:hypothetical protein